MFWKDTQWPTNSEIQEYWVKLNQDKYPKCKKLRQIKVNIYQKPAPVCAKGRYAMKTQYWKLTMFGAFCYLSK